MNAETLETLVLGPDDRLVVVMPENSTPRDLDHYRIVADERGWGDRVLFVAGVEQLAVLRAKEAE